VGRLNLTSVRANWPTGLLLIHAGRRTGSYAAKL